MKSLYEHMADLDAAGRPFAVATVVRTNGSTPQVVGAKLLVTAPDAADPRGKAAGTLGGGCVEADAIVEARKVLRDGGRPVRGHELTEDLAWNTGLVCGGTMWILAERGDEAIAAGGRSMLGALTRAAEGGPPVAIATLLEKDGREMRYGGRIFVETNGRVTGSLGAAALDERAATSAVRQLEHGTPRVVALDETRDLLIEPVIGRPRIVIAGGGHVALAIARQAALLDFDVVVLEDRPEFANRERFGSAHVIEGDVPASIASLDYGYSSFLVVATRGHKLDADCVLAAVRTPVRYVGLLGSRRKTILIEKMLREEGIAEERLRAIHCPVGLDLGGRTPAEIALSVMAEITQLRYQASGRSLGR